MGNDVRIIILNSDDGFATELRSLLLQSSGVKIIAELDEPALLGQAVKQIPADIVLVNLDPTPEAVLPLIGEAIAANPNLAFFATSASTEGPLILRVMRTGIKEFLPKPIDANSLSEAIEKVAAVRTDHREHGKLVTVMGCSGGVGATTIATNLAVELAALTPRRVVLVDLDYRFGQVGTLLDVEPSYTLADLCHSPEQLELQVIERALVKHPSGVQILCRPTSFAQADSITAASCIGLLSALLQHSAYVVADGPSRLEPNAKAILDISDINLLIVQLLVPSVRNALRIIEGMREGGYNLDRSRLICNRVGRDSGNLTTDDVKETLGREVSAQIPDDWATISGSINLGEPLATHSPRSRARVAIQKIAEALHTPETASDDTDTRKKGLIGRIFAAS